MFECEESTTVGRELQQGARDRIVHSRAGIQNEYAAKEIADRDVLQDVIIIVELIPLQPDQVAAGDPSQNE